MIQARSLGRACAALAAIMFPAICSAAVLGLDYGSTELYEISTVDASVSPLGNLGVALASLEFAPDGKLYGYTAGSTPWLYRVDLNPGGAVAVPITRIGGAIYLFEGAMAFSPAGVAYAVNMSQESNNKLFTFDLTTGQVTSTKPLTVGNHDINGLAWRSDNKLVGLDQAQNALVVIDPATGNVTILNNLDSLNVNNKPILGSMGGLTALGDDGYFATAGTGASLKGSNELYRFNMYTGIPELIGAFPATLSSKGISALAVVPEPATIAFLAAGGLMAWPRRRRNR